MSSFFCSPEVVDHEQVGGRSATKMKTKLDVTARDFLNHLRLPMSHPLCGDSNTDFKYGGDGDGGHNASEWEILLSQIGAGIIYELPNFNAAAAKITASANMYATATHVKLIPPPSSIGSTSLLELHDRSIFEALLTASNMSAPSLAMTELWLRLFAIFLGPLCLMYWVHHDVIAAATAANPEWRYPTLVRPHQRAHTGYQRSCG